MGGGAVQAVEMDEEEEGDETDIDEADVSFSASAPASGTASVSEWRNQKNEYK